MTIRQTGQLLRGLGYEINKRGFPNEPNTSATAILNIGWKEKIKEPQKGLFSEEEYEEMSNEISSKTTETTETTELPS